MAEGPVNFGKPIAILVLLGCIGGGYYAYKNWPFTYEVVEGQSYWSVKFPNGWEAFPGGDEVHPTKMVFRGPLSEEVAGDGWAMTHNHGAVVWPDMVVAQVSGTTTNHNLETAIDNKKSMTFEYEDNVKKYLGCAVERGDVLIYVCVGCDKVNFELFRDKFNKVINSVKCHR